MSAAGRPLADAIAGRGRSGSAPRPASGRKGRIASDLPSAAARRLACLAATVTAIAFLAHAARIIAEVNGPSFGGEAVRLAFTAFRAAAKLAVAGEPTAAFDPDRLRAAMAMAPDTPPGDLFDGFGRGRGGRLWLSTPAQGTA